MIAFIIRRLIQAMFVIMIISILAFAIKQNVGDPPVRRLRAFPSLLRIGRRYVISLV